MIASRAPAFSGELAALISSRNAELVDIPVIQPADQFLDMAGEDLRRRIFLTENENGQSLCLRPEFTIPVCRNHIERNAATPKRYAYLGEVFRQRREGGNEFFQAGIEDLGDANRARADARSLADAIAAVRLVVPKAQLETLLGDQAIFEAVLAALGLPRGWQKKLARAFGNPGQLRSLLAGLSSDRQNDALPDRLALLVEQGDEAGLATELEQDMRIAGLSPAAGRAPAEIARRLIEKTTLASIRLPAAAFSALQNFLAIRVPLQSAAGYLLTFARANEFDLGPALEQFEARAASIVEAGLGKETIIYDAAFGRPLDYYTGLVYETRAVKNADLGAVVGGGRYDRLLTMLGAVGSIPGVGFSIWLDRLEKIAGDAQ
ncbi:ATP phosphoribosyltransferase regulatory subunit [Phyllobacterium endophyticum]|uniref:ATP phosphoribosyltransferase regulatory subunit n=1 Tax=Phyllobacterium endophyticum TaxID=1149773 RepID=A0A2P7B165_9HYPH|nr:ATP phosphoribosyltransferase regulatory subunit [Phyllobacterium endophyticum]MBB3237750.1 ATP phosphoribosyltransferase regulatory subunit [Phyllobacterium endophyticum]PSH60203.1 ATP phosphoribosyltransferase regulatory subunit [Phyllobacterium endophyticum]TYR42371.1 ATP phosphoribosyltransferase regulatory subunit [Phyllobacterium endophyticum]